MGLLTKDDLAALEVCREKGDSPGQQMSFFLTAHVHSKIIPEHPATWDEFVDEAASIVYGHAVHLLVTVTRLPGHKWSYVFSEPDGSSAHVGVCH